MIIDWMQKRIVTKIVYYGPAMSGKTTTVKQLLKHYNAIEKIQSIDTTHGRTLYFDFGYLEFSINGWEILINIWSATGQDYYYSTRSSVLNDVDGIIFVADAQRNMMESNIRSWNELISFFKDELNRKIPVVVCINKCDIPGHITMEEFRIRMNLNGFRIYKTVALNGYNVVEPFKYLLGVLFQNKN